MLDRQVFIKEITKLEIEFANKGFTMSEERAKQWYESMKELTEYQIINAVKEILETSKYSPTMADVYSIAKDLREPMILKPIRVIER